jgi:hypothetical protein
MTELNPYEPPKSQVALSEQVTFSSELAEPRRVNAGHGVGWIVSGFALFKRNPWIWILNIFILMIINGLIGQIPFDIGNIASPILGPLFGAGLIFGCAVQDSGNRLKVRYLFAGFKNNTGLLVAVGRFNLLGSIIIFLTIFSLEYLLSGVNIIDLIRARQSGSPPDPETIRQIIGVLLPSILVGLALGIPLFMAILFAPTLVILHSLGAVAAMKLSFRGCLRNIPPFLIYALVLMVLASIIGVLLGVVVPLFLSFLTQNAGPIVKMLLFPIFFLIMLLSFFGFMSTVVASIYTAYKDIFLKRADNPLPA